MALYSKTVHFAHTDHINRNKRDRITKEKLREGDGDDDDDDVLDEGRNHPTRAP